MLLFSYHINVFDILFAVKHVDVDVFITTSTFLF